MDGAIFNLISVLAAILGAVIAYQIYRNQKADNKKNFYEAEPRKTNI